MRENTLNQLDTKIIANKSPPFLEPILSISYNLMNNNFENSQNGALMSPPYNIDHNFYIPSNLCKSYISTINEMFYSTN